MFEFYTKQEVDGLLVGKSPVVHGHPDFTDLTERIASISARMSALTDLVGAANISGAGTFYSKAEAQSLLDARADAAHTHDFSGLASFDSMIAGTVVANLMSATSGGDVNFDASTSRLIIKSISGDVLGGPVFLSGGMELNAAGITVANTLQIISYASGTASNTAQFAESGLSVGPSADGYVQATLGIRGQLRIPGFDATIGGRRALSKGAFGKLLINQDGDFSSVVVGGPKLSALSFNVPSSSILKEGVIPLHGAEEAVESMKVYGYRYKSGGPMRVGVMAEEAGRLVSHDGSSVDVSSMVAVTLRALQGLAAQNNLTAGGA